MLLVAAVSVETNLPIAIVRKEPKPYGTMSQVEGRAPTGARVALVEDVSTTGRQALRAANVLEAEGCRIEVIVLAIDRGGGDELRRSGYRVESLARVRPQD
jgi:orotate phosphoribosyltransferase